MSRNRSPQSAADRDAVPSPELEQVLCDLQSPDDWTRANAVRALCPCRRKDWGVPVYRYVVAMRDDPSPIVRGAVHHDLSENRNWNENWEARLIQERRARRIRVTLAVKATALAELCEGLREETSLPLWAEGSVADEKVTIFCRQMPLRHVMRQLSQSLDYAWVWGKKEDGGHLELTRDPQASNPRKAGIPARRIRDHLLRSHVSLRLSDCGDHPAAGSTEQRIKVTSADLLEALHRASGLPIIADYYTRLVAVDPAAFTERPLRELLDQAAKSMRLRWKFAEGEWLQFHSIWGHFEQLQEVPNRLLSRWAQEHNQAGHLTLETLIEIAGLSHAQRASEEMAEGACEIWGLAEWSLAAVALPDHLRFLAGFCPAQRERATGGKGLPFLEMSRAQQERFLALALGDEPRPSPETLARALLRVEYRPAAPPGGVPAEARLGFCYQLEPGDAGARVTFSATERGCEVNRRCF